jgi:glutamyl-tRNA synthetase
MLSFLLTDDDAFVVDKADAARSLGPDAVSALVAARDALAGLTTWNAGAIQDALRAALVDGLGLKPKDAFGGAVRVAVTGRRVGPPLFESIELLGRERTLDRLAKSAEAAQGGS